MHIADFPENIFYQLASSPEEYPRIINPITAEDELLRMQADAITNHVRIYRVMLARARARNSNTLLHEEHMNDFSEYLSYLPEHLMLQCEDIPKRYILTNNYDSMCLKTEKGTVIIASEVLRYFLYYINIGLRYFEEEVPNDVRGSATLIAIRTLLLNESLDFDLDPRGDVPFDIHCDLIDMVAWQMKFVIGHEYSHHLLDHDSEESLYLTTPKRFSDGEDIGEWIGYSRQHQQEFEADLHAITAVPDKNIQRALLRGGLTLLLGIHIFETVAENLYPNLCEINTHPSTLTRYNKLRAHFEGDPFFEIESTEAVVEKVDSLIDSMINISIEDKEKFEFYGSIYLGQWRGKTLVDRVDY